jgi:hypothetical protein
VYHKHDESGEALPCASLSLLRGLCYTHVMLKAKKKKTHPKAISPLSIARNVYRIATASPAKRLAAISIVVILTLTGFIINEITSNYREDKAYATLTTALETLKPELENASPMGSRWSMEKFCDYTQRVIREGDRNCQAYLSGHVPYSPQDDPAKIAKVFDGVFVKYPDLFQPKTVPSTAKYVNGFSGPVPSAHALKISGLGCTSGYSLTKESVFKVELGCSGSARKEHFPVSNN